MYKQTLPKVHARASSASPHPTYNYRIHAWCSPTQCARSREHGQTANEDQFVVKHGVRSTQRRDGHSGTQGKPDTKSTQLGNIVETLGDRGLDYRLRW